MKNRAYKFDIFSDSEFHSKSFRILNFISESEIDSNDGFQKIETLENSKRDKERQQDNNKNEVNSFQDREKKNASREKVKRE